MYLGGGIHFGHLCTPAPTPLRRQRTPPGKLECMKAQRAEREALHCPTAKKPKTVDASVRRMVYAQLARKNAAEIQALERKQQMLLRLQAEQRAEQQALERQHQELQKEVVEKEAKLRRLQAEQRELQREMDLFLRIGPEAYQALLEKRAAKEKARLEQQRAEAEQREADWKAAKCMPDPQQAYRAIRRQRKREDLEWRISQCLVYVPSLHKENLAEFLRKNKEAREALEAKSTEDQPKPQKKPIISPERKQMLQDNWEKCAQRIKNGEQKIAMKEQAEQVLDEQDMKTLKVLGFL